MIAVDPGHVPSQWFVDSIRRTPETGWLKVQGAALEWAAWGERGRPGLLLLIGNGAHIGWWRPLAPLLVEDFRVATFSWSGMGASDWRDEYQIETFVAEVMAVSEATGMFASDTRPLIAAHSFGGFLCLPTLIAHGERFRGALILDSRLKTRAPWGAQALPVQPFHIHGSREQAIARFRLMPEQPERNRYYLDMLAEEALEEVSGGWRWRADPAMRNKTHLPPNLISLIPQVPCPLAFVRAQYSSSVTDDIWAEQQAAAPANTPFVVIPDAHHHLMIDQPLALLAVMRALLSKL